VNKIINKKTSRINSIELSKKYTMIFGLEPIVEKLI